MAQFSIKSKNGNVTRAIGSPVYQGAYLKPGYLEFAEISSPVPIEWQAGDYVDYSRTGLRYKLYNTPKSRKQGEQNKYGASFVYENVQFFDICKELELAPFVDLVPGDNLIHFSTQNAVAFIGTPANVAERIEACLDYWFPSSNWRVVVVSGIGTSEEDQYLAATTDGLLQTKQLEYLATGDAELAETLNTEAEFNVSGVSCLEALDKVYEIWNGLGWSYSYSNGVNTITIGAPNHRTSENTTQLYNRINDRGIVTLTRSVSNVDEMGTRLYAYGSMRNMPTDYYRNKSIKDAESVDIEHLMLPIYGIASRDYSGWGVSGGLPDARLAYIENASAVNKFGLIPKYAYFDGSDSNYPEIFPSIEGATIGDVIDAKAQLSDTTYVPSLSKWDRTDKIDEIVSAVNPTDNGGAASNGSRYAESGRYETSSATISNPTGSGPFTETLYTHTTSVTADTLDVVLNMSGSLVVAMESQPDVDVTIMVADAADEIVFSISPALSLQSEAEGVGTYTWTLENLSGMLSSKKLGTVNVYMIATRETDNIDFTASVSMGSVFLGFYTNIVKTFTVTIPQIGFDLLQYADTGNGKTISMKSGMCAGRDFPIKAANYLSASDSWLLTLARVRDDSTGLCYPNSDFQIASGDKYVLLDIAMPELYIQMASVRLLDAAKKLLAAIDHESPFYEPTIDSKRVYNEGLVLREGMWMHLAGDENVDNGNDYVLIDTLRIDENASNIPVYDVTLREKKSIEWTENINKGFDSSSSSSPVEETAVSSTTAKAPDWFIVTDVDGSATLKLNPKYIGLWAEGYVSAGGLSDTSGGGTLIASLSDLSDVDDNLNPTQGQVLTYYNGEWTARNGITSLTLTGDVTGTGTSPLTTTIANGAVSAVKLATNAVTTEKIADGAVTAAKLANGAISNAKLEHPSMTLWGQTATLGSTVIGDLSSVGKIIFGAQAVASESGNILEVVMVDGQPCLHSTLPFYSDSFVSAGGLSNTSGGSLVGELDDLSDVTIDSAGLTSGQVLKYNGADWVNAKLGLGDLSNVDLATTAPVSGNALVFNGTSWVPGASGGGSTVTISRVLTSGQKIATITVDGTGYDLYSRGLATSRQDGTVMVAQVASGQRGALENLEYGSSLGSFYGIERNQEGYLFVNIAPATSNVYGSVKVANAPSSYKTVNDITTTSGRYYGVEMNTDGKLMVNVPWESDGGGGTITDYVTLSTAQTVSGRKTFTGGIQLDSSSGLLSWDSTNRAWHLAGNFYADGWISAGGVSTSNSMRLSDMTDISGTPSNGQVLVYNSSTGKWIPTTL